MGITGFSNLQKTMITDLSITNKELPYKVGGTTETVFKKEQSIDIIAKAHAGPQKDPGGGKTLAYLIRVSLQG